MSQTKEPPHIPEEEEFEHGSSAFGFFHRHQKAIIYTAGIFTLLTFSITAAITDAFDRLVGPGFEQPKLNAPGLGEITLTEEDQAIAQGIRRVRSSIFTLGYMAPLGLGDSDHQYTDQLAAIRAMAVRAGVEASDEDVDRINTSAINSFPDVKNVKDLAIRTGTTDLGLYSIWMREALRVSTFLRLSVLGVNQSDEEVLDAVLESNENVSFQVAYIDTKGFKEEIKKGLTDEVLTKFLNEMEKAKSDRFRKPANRVSIKVAMLEKGQFKHEPYLGAEIDKQAQIGDPQIQERYMLHREARYKLPPKPAEKKEEGKGDDKPGGEPEKKDDEEKGNGSPDPLRETALQGEGAQGGEAGKKAEGEQGGGEQAGGAANQGDGSNPANQQATEDAPPQDGYRLLDDDLKKEITEELFSEMVLAKWQASLDRAMAAHMLEAINAATAADIALEKAREEKTKAEAELAEKEGDAELKAAEEKAKAAFEAAEKAAEAAKKAVDDRRSAFDFEAEVKKLAKGRPGMKIVDVSDMKDAEGLRDVAEIGEWMDSHLPGQMTLSGEIYNGRVQSTKKGTFIFQVSKIEERAFKDFKDIKEDLETEYLREKSEENSKDKKEKFEEALEELARKALATEVEKLEKEGKDEAAKKFDEWKKDLEEQATKADTVLKGIGDETLVAYKKMKARLDKLRKELEGADDKKKSIEEEVAKETETKVDDKLKEAYKDILEEAGKKASVKVEALGPLSRKVSSQPRFKFRYSNIIQAVYGTEAEKAEVDDVTDLVDDTIHEVTYMAVCTKVEDAKPSQVSRRQWLAERRGSGSSFAGIQMQKALNKSWTIDALEKGYGWNRPAGSSQKGLAAMKKKSDEAKKKAKEEARKKAEK